jgi:hypothetical protein
LLTTASNKVRRRQVHARAIRHSRPDLSEGAHRGQAVDRHVLRAVRERIRPAGDVAAIARDQPPSSRGTGIRRRLRLGTSEIWRAISRRHPSRRGTSPRHILLARLRMLRPDGVDKLLRSYRGTPSRRIVSAMISVPRNFFLREISASFICHAPDWHGRDRNL